MSLLPLLMASIAASEDTRPVLILFGFESNAGGQALVATLSVDEKTVTPLVQLLRPDTFVFEPLQLDVNQNLDHSGISPHAMYGWHLGCKLQQEAGTFLSGGRTLYICENGQGGSTTSQWNTGGTYFNKLTARYDAAVSEIIAATGENPRVFLWHTHGINDKNASVPAATYKANALDLIDRVDALYPVEAIFMDYFTTTQVPTTYQTVIQEMAAERDNIYLQDWTGLATDDAFHLSRQGYIDMVALKVASMQGNGFI